MVDPEELGNSCFVIISLILDRKSLLSGGRFLSAVRKCQGLVEQDHFGYLRLTHLRFVGT